MGFDALTIRRGTLYVTAADGSWETISDIQAELTGRRKGQVSGRGSFTVRGQRARIRRHARSGRREAQPPRWPTKLSLKGDLLEASFEGHFDVAESLQLSGQAEISTPSVRRGARWFGVPVPSSDGLNAATVKGQINWARHTLAFEDAKVALDGNEASGALVLHVAGERPLIDGTLAFNALDLTPYVEAARSQSFLFDRQTASWSAFDLSFPLIRHFDADLRISAPKVVVKGYGLGRGAATITVRSGKLLADIAELELYSGKVGAQVTVNANELVPRYTLRGKLENFEAGTAGTALFGASVLTGRSTLSLDLAAAGQTPAEHPARVVGQGGADHGRRRPRGARHQGSARPRPRPMAPPGWGALAKGQTGLEQVEARGSLRDGVLITELGAGPLGRRRPGGLGPRRPCRAHARPAPGREAQCAGGQAAQAHRYGGRGGRDGARLLAGALRAARRKPSADAPR